MVNHYKVLEMIGQGGYSIVYRVEDILSGKIYAMKYQHKLFERDYYT